jgi:hypothetical protein
LNSINIIHIGDVHYPENEDLTVGKYGDSSFPQGVKAEILPNPLTQVLREIKQITEDNYCSLLISGDITTKNNTEEYSSFIERLNQLLQLETDWDVNRIHVVPGNHDLARNESPLDIIDIQEKFVDYVNIWKSIGLDVLCTKGIRSSEFIENNCKVKIFSINSCIGCGENRYLKDRLNDKLLPLIDEFIKGLNEDDAKKILFEDLDTPAFYEKDILDLSKEIESLDRRVLPIVLTHHNILPQSQPKVSLYGELMNGGALRSRLEKIDRPIIICHGHIHFQAMECVCNIAGENGNIISIASPKLKNGFNLIKIHYTKSRYPLGCEIIPYKFEAELTIDKSKSINLPLQKCINGSEYLRKNTVNLFNLLGSNYLRYDEVYKIFIDKHRKVMRNTFSDYLRELYWLDMVEIQNFYASTNNWQIRRIL